jgi:hypothetical protein
VVKVVAAAVAATTTADLFKGMGGKKENMQLFETFLEAIVCKHYLRSCLNLCWIPHAVLHL